MHSNSYCGNEFAVGSTELESSACSFPCVGNSAQTCGADEKLNTYEFEAGDEVSLYVAESCYTEATTNHALTDFEYYDDTMTIEKCEAACTGAKYFGVEYGRECYCGNELKTGSVPAPANECSTVCPGNKAQVCGGASRLNVYVLKSSLPVSSSTTQASSSYTSSSTSVSSTEPAQTTSTTTSESSTTTEAPSTSSTSVESTTSVSYHSMPNPP